MPGAYNTLLFFLSLLFLEAYSLPLLTTPSATLRIIPKFTSTSSQSSPSPTASQVLSQRPKLVVAHHMVGNTFPYTVQDWEDDMALASDSGIDGFALNFGRDDFQAIQLDNAYAAATAFPDFKLFLSMDMASLPCDSPDAAQSLRQKVLKYAGHPNQLNYDGKTFISTFAGESCQFGQSSVPEGWKNEFTLHPDLVGKITFVPSFFSDPAKFGDFFQVMDGDFNWNGGWPTTLTSDNLPAALAEAGSEIQTLPSGQQIKSQLVSSGNALDAFEDSLAKIIGSTQSDEQHLQALASIGQAPTRRDNISPENNSIANSRIYMASVSPWFFTHFSPETFNKNFMFLSDEHLYARRWESLISSRQDIDIVQLLTWNDWGESSYVSPVKGALPEGSNAWVDGMPHESLLSITKHYAETFKTGTEPLIDNDILVLYSRPHPVDAEAPDPIGRPKNFDLNLDKLWAIAFLKEPGQVTLSTSDSNTQTFDLEAGISKLSLPISPGDSLSGEISRNGQVVQRTKPTDFTFNAAPTSFNFNTFVLGASDVVDP